VIASPDFQVPPRDALGAKTQARRAIRNRVDNDQRDGLGAAHEICWGAAHAAARHPLVSRERTASQPFARDTVVGDHSGAGPAESPVPSRMAPIPVVAQQWDRPRADLGGRGHVHLEGRAPVLRVDVHDKGGNRFGARQGSQDGQFVRTLTNNGLLGSMRRWSGGRVCVTEPWRAFSHCCRRRAGSATVAHTSRLAPGHRDLD